MNCDRCREALSAMSDGEDPGVSPDRVEHHLIACAACRAFTARLEALGAEARRVVDGESVGPAAGLAARVMARLADRRVETPPPSRPTQPAASLVGMWRIGLLVPALLQLLAAAAALDSGGSAETLHASHDLAAVELALGAGFLLAALRPRLAAGFVPLLGAVVVCLTAVAIGDVAAGRIPPSSEVSHLVDVLGLVMLVGLARHQPRAALRAGLT